MLILGQVRLTPQGLDKAPYGPDGGVFVLQVQNTGLSRLFLNIITYTFDNVNILALQEELISKEKTPLFEMFLGKG